MSPILKYKKPEIQFVTDSPKIPIMVLSSLLILYFLPPNRFWGNDDAVNLQSS